MAYIVPKEIPKTCNKCPFGFCVEYHPFWSKDDEKRNTKTIRCQSVKPFRETTLGIKDETFRAEWCPLVEIPIADVQEVKHSKWELHEDGSGTCKNCNTHQKAVWDMDRWQNFCGHCGARMDGRSDT